jgi:hypothetical protein
MISVDLTAQSRATLRSLEKQFPRTMRAAFGAAAKRARKRLVKVMRQAGGVYGVRGMPPHHEISTYLRPGQKMGGMLADPTYIVMFRRNPDEQVIGWPDPLAKWAVKFQEANTHATTEAECRYLRWRGVKDIPATYSRPDRDVINSFAANLAGEWPGMVRAMFEKYYSSRMKKFGRVT